MTFINALHSKIRLEKDTSVDGDPISVADDEISLYKEKLVKWVVTGPTWSMTGELLPVVAHAAGYVCAVAVWKFFQQLTWRHPDLPLKKGDFGITWHELALQFTVFVGRCLPVWIHDSDRGYAVPSEFRGLGHQTSAFRAVVRYLENTSKSQLFPRFSTL